MNQKEYETVVLAALLHDIGKLLQRGSFGPDLDLRAKHPEFSSTFVSAYAQRFARTVDVELLKTLVQRHHESPTFPPELRVETISDPHARALAYLVSSADNLSAAERGGRAEEYRDFKTAAQASIFARVSLPQPDNPQPPEVLWHLPAKLSGLETLANAFPRKQSDFSPGEYNRHLRDFGEAFAALADKLPWDDFAVVYSHMLALLHRYGWCIPADTQEQQPDVSIFDHLKTTSAIAACLYRYHQAKDGFEERAVRDRNQECFCLVVGDLGGIQPYLFDIANIGAGGVGKRLRARSLYMQMLSDVASHRVIHRLGLPLACVLMSSGGKFYILAPNLPETETAMGELQEQFDRWLLAELNGEISINLAWSPFGNEFATFGAVLESASRALATRKLRRFHCVLQSGGAWCQEAFVVNRDFGGEGACRSCGKFPRERGEEVCPHCRLDAEVGGVIPKAASIAYYDQQVPGAMPLLDYFAAVQRHDQAFLANPRPYLVVQLNDAELAPLARVPAAFRYIANHIPVEDGEPLTFEQIAKWQSPDLPLLGYLKADLDFLGSIFHFGLKREEGGDFDTISRITTLSRQLDLFFSGWVQRLLESTDFRECYAVFSGGDDLFVVGPWKQTVALAQRVHDGPVCG